MGHPVCASLWVKVSVIQLCFSQFTTGHRDPLFSQVIMTFHACFKVFSLSSSHSICVEVQKRPNMQEWCERVRKGRGWSYTTQSSFTLRASVLVCTWAEHNAQDGEQHACIGEILDEKQSGGRMFFSLLITNKQVVFLAPVVQLEEEFHNLAKVVKLKLLGRTFTV